MYYRKCWPPQQAASPRFWSPVPPQYSGEINQYAPGRVGYRFSEFPSDNRFPLGQTSELVDAINSINDQIAAIREGMEKMERRLSEPERESEGLADSIFRLSGAIRSVAVLDSNNNLVEFNSRERGVAAREEAMRDIISTAPVIMLGSVQRLKPFYGEVRYVTARLEETILVAYQTVDGHVVLTINPAVNPQLIDNIGAKLNEVIASHTARTGIS